MRPDWLEARHNLALAQGELLRAGATMPLPLFHAASQQGLPESASAFPHYPLGSNPPATPGNYYEINREGYTELAPDAVAFLPERCLSQLLDTGAQGEAHDPEAFWARRASPPQSPTSNDGNNWGNEETFSDVSSEVASTMVPEDDSSDEEHCHHAKHIHHRHRPHDNDDALSEAASTMIPEDDSSDENEGASHHNHHRHHRGAKHADDESICTGSSDSSSDEDGSEGSESILASESTSASSETSSMSFEPVGKPHLPSAAHFRDNERLQVRP